MAKIYEIVNQNEQYIKLRSDDEITLLPTKSTILVDDESGYISIKNTGSRKTIGLIQK
jgi:hypothetical protein